MQREPLTIELVQWIHDEGLRGKIPRARMEHHVVIGRLTAEMLAILGCDDLELFTSVAVLEKMLFDHAISTDKLLDLSRLVCLPKSVYRSASRPNDSVVVVSLETLRANPILVPIHLGKQLGRSGPVVHWVSSCYAKDNPAIFERWNRDGLLIWSQK